MRNIQLNDIPYEPIIEQFLTDEIATNFDQHRQYLLTSAADYKKNVLGVNKLHELTENRTYPGLVNYYENNFVSGVFKEIYDKIRASAPKCPHCGTNKVSCLDHFLPKQKFNLFAIFPLNLIPSCKDCNEAKGTYSAVEYERLLLHPYYDNFNDYIWLGAKIINKFPVVVEFFVIENVFNEKDTNRLINYFKKLKLDSLYETNASNELIGIHLELHNLFIAAGTEGVTANLSERAESWASVYPNSWQAALYRGLYSDTWYCGEYFGLKSVVPGITPGTNCC